MAVVTYIALVAAAIASSLVGLLAVGVVLLASALTFAWRHELAKAAPALVPAPRLMPVVAG